MDSGDRPFSLRRQRSRATLRGCYRPEDQQRLPARGWGGACQRCRRPQTTPWHESLRSPFRRLLPLSFPPPRRGGMKVHNSPRACGRRLRSPGRNAVVADDDGQTTMRATNRRCQRSRRRMSHPSWRTPTPGRRMGRRNLICPELWCLSLLPSWLHLRRLPSTAAAVAITAEARGGYYGGGYRGGYYGGGYRGGYRWGYYGGPGGCGWCWGLGVGGLALGLGALYAAPYAYAPPPVYYPPPYAYPYPYPPPQ